MNLVGTAERVAERVLCATRVLGRQGQGTQALNVHEELIVKNSGDSSRTDQPEQPRHAETDDR